MLLIESQRHESGISPISYQYTGNATVVDFTFSARCIVNFYVLSCTVSAPLVLSGTKFVSRLFDTIKERAYHSTLTIELHAVVAITVAFFTTCFNGKCNRLDWKCNSFRGRFFEVFFWKLFYDAFLEAFYSYSKQQSQRINHDKNNTSKE